MFDDTVHRVSWVITLYVMPLMCCLLHHVITDKLSEAGQTL